MDKFGQEFLRTPENPKMIFEEYMLQTAQAYEYGVEVVENSHEGFLYRITDLEIPDLLDDAAVNSFVSDLSEKLEEDHSLYNWRECITTSSSLDQTKLIRFSLEPLERDVDVIDNFG
jgi:hypothetical protein